MRPPSTGLPACEGMPGTAVSNPSCCTLNDNARLPNVRWGCKRFEIGRGACHTKRKQATPTLFSMVFCSDFGRRHYCCSFTQDERVHAGYAASVHVPRPEPSAHALGIFFTRLVISAGKRTLKQVSCAEKAVHESAAWLVQTPTNRKQQKNTRLAE